jgi:hypothetical protein
MNKILLITLLVCILSGCAVKRTTNNKNVQVIDEQLSALSNHTLSPGIPVYAAEDINYKRDNKSILNIRFSDFAIAGVASEPEKWGYFQFPKIGRKPDGSLQAKWNMKADAMSAYGTEGSGSANSADGGKTWQIQQKEETTGELLLPNGDRIEIATPRPIQVTNLKLPKPIGAGGDTNRKSNYAFYRLNELPDSCRGVYLKRLKKGETEWKTEQDSLYDPDAARHTIGGKMPIVWWGDMHVAADGSVIAGVYPGSLIKPNGAIEPKSGVFFYRSTDSGHSWRIQGRIPYQPDLIVDPKGSKRMGYTEPAFEILKDGTFLCVMRTSDGVGIGPMYASHSKDLGKTWSKPEVIAANGVLPRLLQLDNGIVVLASGRPGVQLRFLKNGEDKTWTEAFEMLPYTSENEQVSCGYTGLLSTGRDSFLMILSDFKYKTEQSDIRKAIKVREVVVKPQ